MDVTHHHHYPAPSGNNLLMHRHEGEPDHYHETMGMFAPAQHGHAGWVYHLDCAACDYLEYGGQVYDDHTCHPQEERTY